MVLRQFTRHTQCRLQQILFEARQLLRVRCDRSKPELLVLEQRVLMSASPLLAVEQATADTGAAQPEASDYAQVEAARPVVSAPDSSETLEVVFVDSAVRDHVQLVDALRQNAGPDAEPLKIVMLDHESDGIEQITRELEQLTNVGAVHVLSHGNQTSVQLGNTTLSLTNVSDYADHWQAWRPVLADDADVLFYGCDLAATGTGQDLLLQISSAVGADVAASSDLTGHSDLGGDWDLEFQHGLIDTSRVLVIPDQQQWLHLLAAPSDLQVTSSESGGLAINHDGGNDVYLRLGDADGVIGGRTSLTYEVQFSTAATGSQIVLGSYAVTGTPNELLLSIHSNGDLELRVDNAPVTSSSIDYRTLADGQRHALGITWDNTSGDWEVYVDGVRTDSGTGLAAGYTLESGGVFLLGQEQDSVDGGFNPSQVFSGVLYDLRVFDDVRTPAEMAAAWQSRLPWETAGLMANWQFRDLSLSGVVTETVAGNNLTVQHATGTGFTTSVPEQQMLVSEHASNGTQVAQLSGQDADRTALINTLLAADSDLTYSDATGKFYKYVASPQTPTGARAQAALTTLNGVVGQLATIQSAAEQEIVVGIAATHSQLLHLGATDSGTEGDWYWEAAGVKDQQFWTGGQAGSAVNDAWTNWDSGSAAPDNFGGTEHYLLINTSGTWGDVSNSFVAHSLVEWDADSVLDNAGGVGEQPLTYSIQTQTAAGAFAIDADSGVITVADSTLIDYETLSTHLLTVQLTDVDGGTYSEVLSIAIGDAPDAPEITSLAGDTLSYVEDSGAMVIDRNAGASVVDADSADFDTGTLTVSIVSGGVSAEDVLGIRSQGTGAGQIGVAGSVISYGGTVIGTAAGGTNGADLVITFNAGATPAAVSALVQNITYQNTDSVSPDTASRTVRFVLTDGDGATSVDYDTTVAVARNNDVPSDLQVVQSTAGGVAINTDGGNDAYLLADDGDAVFGGRTAFTYEVQFSTTDTSSLIMLGSYAAAGSPSGNEVALFIHNTSQLAFHVGGPGVTSTAVDYSFLTDGQQHAVAVTWDSTTGAWEMYVDGVLTDSGSGLQSGATLRTGGAFLLGQEQDSVQGGFDSSQIFSGILYDVRVFDDIRTSTEIAASYNRTLSHNTNGLVANWRFDRLATDGTVAESVSGNHLTVQHASGTGFTNSAPGLTLVTAEHAVTGTIVGQVDGTDEERTDLINTLLASDSDLTYSAAAGKFYRYVDTPADAAIARGNAAADTLNGVSGQLATIRSATEQKVLAEIAALNSHHLLLGASDSSVEGEWYWEENGVPTDRFWTGGQGGFPVGDAWTNWNSASSAPDNFAGIEHQLVLIWNNSSWGDIPLTSPERYVVEWDADTVLDNAGGVGEQPLTYSIQAQTVAGAFAIDADTGVITVADQSLLDYESATLHNVTIRVTDVGGGSHQQLVTIALTNQGGEATQTIPGAQTTNEDVDLIFSSGNGNAITVGDNGSTDAILQVTLTVTNGTLHLSQLTGLSFVAGADGTAGMTLQGTESALNNALDGLRYTPTSHYSGSANLQVSTSVTADLVAQYTFEAGDASDDSTGTPQHDGVLNGNATVVTDGVRGEVLQLDGTPGTDMRIPGNLGAPSSVTLAAWVNSSGSYMDVITVGDAVGLRFDDVNDNGTRGLSAIHWDGSQFHVTPTGQFISGTGWRHIALSFDDAGKQMTVYLDGVVVAQRTYATSLDYGASDTYLGSNQGASLHFNGRIDDARIYARTLSADEIAGLAIDSPPATGSIALTITEVADAPVISQLHGDSLATAEDAAAAVISQGPAPTIDDVDSPNFDSGILTVAVVAGGAASEDVLAIRDQGNGAGQIGISGGNVRYGGTIIGTWTGGTGGQALTVTFNNNADTVSTAALLHQITYQNTNTGDPLAGIRTVRFTLTDGDGGHSGNVDTTVSVTAVNDVPSGVPTINGTPQEDEILTADVSGISDADGIVPMSFTYQWYRDAVAVAGATSATYSPGDEDVGARMSVQVRYVDALGNTEGPLSSAAMLSVTSINDVPVGLPVVVGTAREDETLTADISGISDVDGIVPGSFTYQWLRDGVAVSGATSATYTLDDDDFDTEISVYVGYQDQQGTTEGPIASLPTASVAGVNDAPTGLPVISGIVQEDETLSVDVSGIADVDGIVPGSFSFQWFRNGTLVSGATSATYTLGDADVGLPIHAEVRFLDAQGTTEGPLVAAATGPVVNVNDEEQLLRSAGMGVQEGETGPVITQSLLETIDVDHLPGELQYSLTTDTSSGTLRLDGTALVTGATWTQADINAGRLTYDHDDSEVFADRFEFEVDDGVGTTTSGRFDFTISSVNDNPPVVTAGQILQVSELASSGDAVGNVDASDIDSVGTLQNWQIVGGNPAGIFAIDAVTGAIRVADTSQLDFEDQSAWNLQVTVSDGVATSLVQTVRINVLDQNEAPELVAPTVVFVDENSAAGAVPGIVGSTDQDAGDSATYSILTGNSAGLFAVNATTGDITVTGAGQLDFESQSSYSLLIQVQDTAGLVDTAVVRVELNDLNEVPHDILLSNTVIAENSVNGTFLGQASVLDVDAGDTAAWSLVDDADGRFRIDGSTGRLTVSNGQQLNFEAADAHTIRIQVTDSGGLSRTETFVVSVTDVNEAPVGVDDLVIAQQSRTILHQFPGLVTNDTDPDGDLLRVIVVSGASFGELDVRGDGSLKYTPIGTFWGTDTFTYIVTDGRLNSDLVTVTVQVQPTGSNPGPKGSIGGGQYSAAPGDNGAGSGRRGPADGESGFGNGGDDDSQSREYARRGEKHHSGRRGSLQAGLFDESGSGPSDSSWLDSGTARMREMVRPDVPDHRDLRDTVFRRIVSNGPTVTGLFSELRRAPDVDNRLDTVASFDFGEKLVVGSTLAVSSSISVGYVVWILRGGSLLTAFMSQVPVWQHFDPLPVLDQAGTRPPGGEDDDDDALHSLIS